MGKVAIVTGAAGFVGHHLVKYLVARGWYVRGVDIVEPAFEATRAHEFLLRDLRDRQSCMTACEGAHHVYHLAADIGGIGYISAKHAEIARNNSLINLHMLEAARLQKVERFFFSSTACIYPLYRQLEPDAPALKESDAIPAQPEDGYGWEKLYMEQLCRYYQEDYGLETRVARFHNVYGPLGAYDGGKEKAPAAICRKIAALEPGDAIEVWGDGEQTRSFMYIDDCIEGIYRIMQSDVAHPLNLGSDEVVSINELVAIVAAIAGKRVPARHNLSMPQGVRARNSDNSLLRDLFRWEPSISLCEGLEPTYRWISEQLSREVPAFRPHPELSAAVR